MAGRRLLKRVRSKRLLFNLLRAVCRLLNLIQAIHRNLQPCPGRSPPNRHCPGRRSAVGHRLFNFVRAGRHQIKLVLTSRRLLSLVRAGCQGRPTSANPDRLMSTYSDVICDINLVVNGLPTIKYLLREPLSF